MDCHVMTMTLHEGTLEIVCPVCGRTILIDVLPFNRRFVDKGDQLASHTASMGGLHLSNVEITV